MSKETGGQRVGSNALLGLNQNQLRVLHLMNSDLRRDLYQGAQSTHHWVTYSADEQYRPLTTEEVHILERKGLISRKWPDQPEIACWVLRPNTGS